VDFLQPVEVGDLVSMMASVNYVGNSSIMIGIKVIAENVKSGLVKHTNTSYFTMVAKNEEGELMQVPSLILETKEDVRRFAEAVKRKELRKGYQEKMEAEKSAFTLDKEQELLKNQRCEINLKKE
jgi:acyl-CoA hydrolase